MKKILAYILCCFVVLNFCACKKMHEFNDTITLRRNDKIPYGTYASYKLLQKEFPHAVIETNRYPPAGWKNLSNDSTKQVLLIVTKSFDPSESDLDYLTGFVQKGNYVFISTSQLTRNAAKFFKLRTKQHYNYYAIGLHLHHEFDPFDTTAVILDTASFQQPYFYQYPGADFTNQFSSIDSNFSYPLGYSKDTNLNIIAINSLNGTFFIHSAPVAFTNFFLLYKNNREYFEKLMALLPADAKKIVWDEYYLNQNFNNVSQPKQGLLTVILKIENFQWTFWVAMLLLGLYLLTEIKRKQRIIPNYEKPKNDSLEFVTTIGKLYYEKADHKNLAEKLSLYFLDYVRNQYKISTAEINDSFVQQLAVKSGKDVNDIQSITEMMHKINLSETITQKQLMDYYEKLEHFYKTT